MDNGQLKADIRADALARRALLLGDARELANRQVFERAHKLDAFQLATSVHIYRSFGDEVETWPFFEYAWGLGKTVAVPVTTASGLNHVRVTRETQWQSGPFGIPEPSTSEGESMDDVTLVVVPVVAFDKAGNRIGYGKGYYDRFLANTRAMTMGLAFECQRSESIPTESHDIALSCIATEQRWYIP